MHRHRVREDHGYNMEVDLQSLFGLSCHVMCTAVLIGFDPATPQNPPAFGLVYEVAIGQQRQTTSLYNPLAKIKEPDSTTV